MDVFHVHLPIRAAPNQVAEPQHTHVVEVEASYGVGTTDLAQRIGVHRRSFRRLDEPSVVVTARNEVPDSAPMLGRAVEDVPLVEVLLGWRQAMGFRRSSRFPRARISGQQPHASPVPLVFPQFRFERRGRLGHAEVQNPSPDLGQSGGTRHVTGESCVHPIHELGRSRATELSSAQRDRFGDRGSKLLGPAPDVVHGGVFTVTEALPRIQQEHGDGRGPHDVPRLRSEVRREAELPAPFWMLRVDQRMRLVNY